MRMSLNDAFASVFKLKFNIFGDYSQINLIRKHTSIAILDTQTVH